jgi:hypothetical protein
MENVIDGGFVRHSSVAYIQLPISPTLHSRLSSSRVVNNEGGFSLPETSLPMLWSFRYAPGEERRILNRSSHRLTNPRSGAEPLLNSRGESKDTRIAVT